MRKILTAPRPEIPIACRRSDEPPRAVKKNLNRVTARNPGHVLEKLLRAEELAIAKQSEATLTQRRPTHYPYGLQTYAPHEPTRYRYRALGVAEPRLPDEVRKP